MVMGRNEPYWCLSGKKYKKCHLGREKEEPYSFDKLVNLVAQINKSQKRCMHPLKAECHGKIISSHTIQRAKSLEKIANEQNRVYECSARNAPFEHAKNAYTNEPVLIHINRASTFDGFCSFHDNALFSDIENFDYDIRSKYHAFLVAYKCLCYDIKLKELGIDVKEESRQFLDRGYDYEAQVETQVSSLGYIARTKLDLTRLEYLKKEYDKMLVDRSFDDICYLAISFQNVPDVMCTGCIAMAYDFYGKFLQKENLESLNINEEVFPIKISPFPMYLHKKLHFIQFSLFSTENKNIALFAWHKDSSSIYIPFIKSFLDVEIDRVSDALIAMSLVKIDNIYMRQGFWDVLPNAKKDRLRIFINRISLSNCLKGIDVYLRDSKPYFADWMPQEVFSNVEEFNSLSNSVTSVQNPLSSILLSC